MKKEYQSTARKRIYFFLCFLISGTLLVMLTLLIVIFEQRRRIDRLSQEEEFAVELNTQIISSLLYEISNDLLFLSHQNEVVESKTNLDFFGRECRQLLGLKGLYNRICYIDDSGMETLCVDYADGTPRIVSPDELQDQSHQDYFRKILSSDEEDIHMSLSASNGNDSQAVLAETLMHFAGPVFAGGDTLEGAPVKNGLGGDKGLSDFRGVVVLDILADELVSYLNRAAAMSLGGLSLVGAAGEWSITEDSAGVFHLNDKLVLLPDSVQSGLWQTIATRASGQMKLSEGILSFSTVAPFRTMIISTTPSPTCDYCWKLVSFISREAVKGLNRNFYLRVIFSVAGLLLLLLILSWVIAQILYRKQNYRKNLWYMANHDPLTGIANRSYFLDRLSIMLNQSLRYNNQFALLYLDLDGFKQVNDSMGHEAGDIVLQRVAAKIQHILRASDIFARIGGDEFMVLLPELADRTMLDTVSDKIKSEVEAPLLLNNVSLSIGISIGVACYPEDGNTAEELINQADMAMYLQKARRIKENLR